MSQNDLNGRMLGAATFDAWHRYSAVYRRELGGPVVAPAHISTDVVNGVRRSFVKSRFQMAKGVALTFDGVRFETVGAEFVFFCLYDGEAPAIVCVVPTPPSRG